MLFDCQLSDSKVFALYLFLFLCVKIMCNQNWSRVLYAQLHLSDKGQNLSSKIKCLSRMSIKVISTRSCASLSVDIISVKCI